MKEMTFMQACRDFFGLLPNQAPLDFGKEIKQLTEADRAQISVGLEKNGYKIMPSTVMAK